MHDCEIMMMCLIKLFIPVNTWGTHPSNCPPLLFKLCICVDPDNSRNCPSNVLLVSAINPNTRSDSP